MQNRKQTKWDEYNKGLLQGALVEVDTNHFASTKAKSYTHHFFQAGKLTKFLNSSCKKMLQLGAADGRFIAEYKKSDWSIIGYDYSAIAVKELTKKNIESRLVDLNSIDSETNNLCYATVLHKDISNPTNILLIRVLQYLDPNALNLLLFNLISHAAPGSVFFIAGNTNNHKSLSYQVQVRV